MEKKIYERPCITLLQISIEPLLASSSGVQGIQGNNADMDNVYDDGDAGMAASRRTYSAWEDEL